jgi:hypothetical protein
MIDGSADRAESAILDERRRYLAHSEISITARDRLVVAGILRSDTMLDLAPDALVNELLPHDADLVIERTDPDLLLVESRALGAGGAWAGAGEPSVADVALHLRRALEVARSIGRPSVLWWNGPRTATPGAIPFESQFDLVVATNADASDADTVWSPGVQLARFSPLGTRPDRPFRPVAHGRWDEAPPRGLRSFLRESVAALAAERLELWIDAESVGRSTWLPDGHSAQDVRRVLDIELPDLYRGQGLFLAEPLTERPGQRVVSTHTLRQLASGARVVSGPNPSLAAALGEWIDWADDPAELPEVVRDATKRGARTPTERRRLLRRLFQRHDTSRAVGNLARFVGESGATRRRDASVVARLDAHVRPGAFVDSVVLQEVRPSEALIAAGDPADARTAINELERAGIKARHLPPSAAGRGLARSAADFATTDWLWLWSHEIDHDPRFLVDAVLHGVMTGAEAVGRGQGVEDRFVSGPELRGVVVSREAAMRLPEVGDDLLTAWSDRGATVYAVGTDHDDG